MFWYLAIFCDIVVFVNFFAVLRCSEPPNVPLCVSCRISCKCTTNVVLIMNVLYVCRLLSAVTKVVYNYLHSNYNLYLYTLEVFR